MKFLKKIKESRLNLILLLLYPIVTFYLLEWFTHNPWKTMKATPQVLNIVMFELVALLLFALFGRLHAALMTETLFFFLYGLVNYFVLNFRSVPIQPWDLFSISTAASVADNYEYTLDKQALLVVIGFLVLLILEFFCRYTLKKGTWKFRIPTAAVVCALLVAFGGMFHSDEIVQQKLRLYRQAFYPDHHQLQERHSAGLCHGAALYLRRQTGRLQRGCRPGGAGRLCTALGGTGEKTEHYRHHG